MNDAVLMKAEAGTDTTAGVAAVDRALAIVAAVAAATQPCSLAQLAEATGLYKSTILRLLGSLEKAGYIIRLRQGAYALGATAFRLGIAYERSNPLGQVIPPLLEELVQAGSESASFHIRQGPAEPICLFRIDSQHATLDRIDAGDVLPLYRGAAGRVLLAFEGEPGDDYDALRAEHFAISLGEREAGCAGMAAPVFGTDGALQGAVSLSGAADRFTEATIAIWRPRLLAAAAEMTRALGGRFPELRR